MRRILTIFYVLMITGIIDAQDNNSNDINDFFELRVDSVEQKITMDRWGTDTSYYLHFQVKNITLDTLTFITNTCFYYNHSILEIEKLIFDLNPKGGCYLNSHNIYELAPNESFYEAQWITGFNLYKLKEGSWSATWFVPILKDDQSTYRVDGRSIVENVYELIYNGKIKIMNSEIDNRKRKKKKCT